MPTPNAIRRHLQGAEYPATRHELAEHAEANEAPDDVIDALEALDEDLYASADEVIQELADVDAVEPDDDADDPA